ncbi:MAG: gas vesicle protein K [Nitrospiraceae bacterium]|nr:gas vesicle protein K [Nitrospiraceae bacterium]
MSQRTANRNVRLSEALDAVLGKGAIVSGDITLSVADVDLVFVGLKVLLASVDTADRIRGKPGPPSPGGTVLHGGPRPGGACPPWREENPIAAHERSAEEAAVSLPRIDMEESRPERGLAKLVLTVVDLVRRLMEKQAIRRMDGGSLTEDEMERLGNAFRKLEERMEDLKKLFGLDGEELELDLGPLGKLA